MNKFKIWFSRNDIKIVTVIVIIVVCNLVIKNLNNYYKDQKEEIANNTSTEDKISNSLITNEDDMEKIAKQTDEYKDVQTVLNKILKALNLAQVNNDQSAKKDVFEFCTDEMKNRIYSRGRAITEDNIAGYLSGVESLEYINLEEIFKFSEDNNVKRYIAKIIYDNHQPVVDVRYMIINMDYNNRTFSYDGDILSLNYIDYDKKISEIENKESNTF